MSDPNPARIVADADVLAADLLVGGDAREALDVAREHSWIELVASDELLADAEWVVRELADDELARDWREKIDELRVRVEQSPGDHPALASAHAGNAAHVLSYDDSLRTAETGTALQGRISVSVKRPDGFARLFDAESLYEEVVSGEYPGPDGDARE
ncbi:DUF7384 family protein [Haladaptatus salinisoli]|uniref:DUF7384 family protein n=1 Tax=Haladaptatus salinisoli TaxID=2884876 RepID=UPI001D0AFE7C|nr:hypothetical protein [Haladaptatus salinisoli]